MGAGISSRAEETVAVSLDIVARVLPPCFRIGAETEQIAINSRLSTDCRRGPVNSQLGDIDGLAIDIAGDVVQAVSVPGDVLCSVAGKREIGADTAVTVF